MDTVIANGTPAPQIILPDLIGNLHSLSQALGKIVLVNFWSAECPWAERADRELLQALPGWQGRVVIWEVAANANEPLELLQQVAQARGIPLVLHDAHHHAADFLGAQTTPHVFLFDGQGILRYQGGFDDVTFRQRIPTRHYVIEAVQALLDGRDPEPGQTPPYGCTIVRWV